MFNVEYLTKVDSIRKKQPVVLVNIRTMSVTKARILLSDDHDHITILDPDELVYISLLNGGCDNE